MDTAAGKSHQSSSSVPPILFIAGPTAVGKSEVALIIAEKLQGEIVSVDSMQVYRGLDIGTAKPTAEERRRVRHHLLDVAELGDEFDASQFVQLAEEAVAEIQTRGHLPIFCGGTGLYFKAFLEGLGPAPAANPALRAELYKVPLPELVEELRKADPVTYSRIDRKNPRRVIRALEVIRLTGKPFSEQRVEWSSTKGGKEAAEAFFVLTRNAEDLQARINARVEEMFRRGLVGETEALLQKGLAGNKTALQALGYRQVVEYLRGARSLTETVELVKRRTRQFAKRQMTWFRTQAQVEWVTVKPGEPAEETAEEIIGAYKRLGNKSAEVPE